MRLAGLLRVKNEGRWIRESVESLLPICETVAVFDDNSEDDTVAICRGLGDRVKVLESPYEGLDEKRDKDYALRWLMTIAGPEWVLLIDGDEVLEAAGQPLVLEAITRPWGSAYRLKIAYLWDQLDRIRVDGIYGRFYRPSLFQTAGSCMRFRATGRGGNFHCSSVPADCLDDLEICEARLKHYGYLHREDRIRKYHWYNRIDPGNAQEDDYRHMVAGDLPEIPADARLRHAGPVQFEPWP